MIDIKHGIRIKGRDDINKSASIIPVVFFLLEWGLNPPNNSHQEYDHPLTGSCGWVRLVTSCILWMGNNGLVPSNLAHYPERRAFGVHNQGEECSRCKMLLFARFHLFAGVNRGVRPGTSDFMRFDVDVRKVAQLR